MPRANAIAFAVAAMLFAMARSARADVTQGTAMLQFGVPAPIAAFALDPAHFVYVPVLGPWLDIARAPATSALVVDGVFQDCVAFAFVATFVAQTDVVSAVTWTVTPWFPQSGGGGLSLRAKF